MKKHMKKLGSKLLALCMALAMVVTSIAIAPVTAKAGEGEGTELTVHFKNEKNWDSVYAKFGSGTSWDAIPGLEYCKNNDLGGTISANASNSGWYSFKITTTASIEKVCGLFNCGEWGDGNQTSNYTITVADATGKEVWITYADASANDNVTVAYTAPEKWVSGAAVTAPADPATTDTGISKPDETKLKLYYYITDAEKSYEDYAMNVWGGASLTEAGTYLTVTAWGNQTYRKLKDTGMTNTIDGLDGKWAYAGLDSSNIEGVQFVTADGGDDVWNSEIKAQGLTEAYYVPGYGWYKEAACQNEIKAPTLQDEFYIVGAGDVLGNWDVTGGVKMTKMADGIYQVIVAMPAGSYEFTPVQDPANFAWSHQYQDYENKRSNYKVTVESDSRILFTVKNPDSTTNKAEVTAEAVENIYTVEFKDGDTVLKTELVEAGKAANAPELPVKTGYTAAWDKDFSAITADTTVNVVWTENVAEVKSYTVTFKDGDTVLKTEAVEAGKAATAPELPAKTGYTAAWDKDFSAITADTIVSVTWTANTYTLTYHVNGGSKLKNATKTVTYDDVYGTLASPKRKGYTFKGWYTAKTKGTKVTSSTKVTGDATIYAQWKKVTKPGTVTVKSVKNSAKKTMKVSVKSVKGADGYEIRYSTKESMKNAKKVTTTKTSTSIKKLTKGKTYYVQVRAYKIDSAGKKVYSSKYSKTVKVKIAK